MLGIENIALDKVVRLGLKLERHCFEDFLRHKKYNMRVNHASQVDCTGLQRTNSGVVREQPTLPEGQEDDRLDGEELEDRVERPQEVLGAEVEEEQGVECERDGDVVDQGDVEVAFGRVPVAVLVETVGLEPDGHEGHDRLDDTKL